MFGGFGGYLFVECNLMLCVVLVLMCCVFVEFVGFNLVIGLMVSFIDLFVHFGGLVVGVVFGVVLVCLLMCEVLMLLVEGFVMWWMSFVGEVLMLLENGVFDLVEDEVVIVDMLVYVL